MNKLTIWLNRRSHWGIILFRLFAGFRLLHGVMDNISSWKHMLHFRDFLAAFHFPYPLLAALLSVYAQAIAAILLITGWKLRIAALILIANFSIALLIVHRKDSLELMTPALFFLFTGLLFLFYRKPARSQV